MKTDLLSLKLSCIVSGSNTSGEQSTPKSQQSIHVELLGPIRAWRNKVEVALGPPKQRAVFGVLATRMNRIVLHHELIDAVWGDELPPSASNSVHTYVSGLRRALEPGLRNRETGSVLLSVSGGYTLQLNAGELDTEIFHRTSEQARERHSAGDLEEAVRLYDSALALWRGDAYSGAPGPFADLERSRLNEIKLHISELRAEAMLALGHQGALVSNLAALASAYPLREKLRALLMLALYRCGRQADALKVFRETRTLLVGELGIEPGQELSRLNDSILANDRALNLTPRPKAVAGKAAIVKRGQPVPAQLPRAPRGFIARTDELVTMRKFLIRPPEDHSEDEYASLAVIHGPAGSGKTALTVQFAHSVAHEYPDGQLYVDLHAYSTALEPVTPFEALGFMLRSLGVEPDSVPAELDDRAAIYRSLSSGKRMLIIFDNTMDVESLRHLLPGTNSCLVLVTSRNRLAGLSVYDGAYSIQLSPLSMEDSLRMLASMIGQDRVAGDLEGARELARLCDHLPLALRIAAYPLTENQGVGISELLEGLRDDRTRLDALAVEGDPTASLRAVFSSSYRTLPAEAARVFRLLGHCAASDITVQETQRLCGLCQDKASRVLKTLAHAHLLEQPGLGCYRLSSLLRSYAREQAATISPRTRWTAAQ